jgi:hypothetical protein
MANATPRCSSGIIYQIKSLWQLHSMIFHNSLKNVMLLAAVLCHCVYQNGIRNDQWRVVNHRDIHIWLVQLTAWSRYEMPYCEVSACQLSGKLLLFFKKKKLHFA